MADAVSCGSCRFLFKVLTLNVAICIVHLHFSNFCYLSSVLDLLNTEARTPTSSGRILFFTRTKWNGVWTCGLIVGHVYLPMAVFLFIYRNHSYR